MEDDRWIDWFVLIVVLKLFHEQFEALSNYHGAIVMKTD